MRFCSPAAMVLVLSGPSAARAEDVASLQHRIDQLESELKELRERVDALGPASAPRQVLTVDPVFMGAGAAEPSPLAMEDPRVNCPPHSFVTGIQVLKTGNTVSQIRYACRGIQ